MQFCGGFVILNEVKDLKNTLEERCFAMLSMTC